MIMHPALEAKLLGFPALSTGSTTAPYGVFRPLVPDACRVLTNHAATRNGRGDFKDFLASDRDGRHRIPVDDAPLEDNCYHFLGPPEVEANRNSPIVKTLSAFTFPFVLPDRWARTAALWQQLRPSYERYVSSPNQMSTFVSGMDEKCAVARYPNCASFHVPSNSARILKAIQTSVYGRLPPLTPVPALAQLRSAPTSSQKRSKLGISPATWPSTSPARRSRRAASTTPRTASCCAQTYVQCSFDAHGFVFYPNSSHITGPGAQAGADNDNLNGSEEALVAYFVGEGYLHLPDLFHRRRVAIHPQVPVEFLYARFAHAIIHLPREKARSAPSRNRRWSRRCGRGSGSTSGRRRKG